MNVLLKININYADEFDLDGFCVFDSEKNADFFVKKIIEDSKNDDEYIYFGTNESVGNFKNSNFEKIKINETYYNSLYSTFYDRYLDFISFGFGNILLSKFLDEYPNFKPKK